jgi:hypothetical protein
MIITRQSPISGKIHSLDLDITEEQVAAWQAGAYIQNAFPNLSPDEREFLKTGITAEEWEAMFGGEEE